ncbi:RHS repeat domain-containing protein [Pseudoalteromonas xiamenensis]
MILNKSQTAISTVTTSNSDLDEYGNVGRKVVTVKDDSSTNTKTTIREFNDLDPDNWFINKLTKSTVETKVAGNALIPQTVLDTTLTVVTDFEDFDASRRPKTIKVSDPTGKSRGQATAIKYNQYGLPETKSITAQVFNKQNSWQDVTRTESFIYSADGYFVETHKNALGHEITTKFNAETGLPDTVTRNVSSSNSVTTTYGYDAYLRPYSVKEGTLPIRYSAIQRPDADAPANAASQVVSASLGTPTSKVYFDRHGRTLRTITEGFNQNSIYQDTEYDAVGRVIFTSQPYFAGNARYGTTFSGFDALGRVGTKQVDQTCTSSSQGTLTVDYTYTNLDTDLSVTESCYQTTLTMARTYNTLGQLMSTTDAKGGLTKYAYDSQGNPVVIRDAKNNDITATYNALGQKVSVNDPNQGSTTFAYNGFGELQQESRPDSKTVTYYVDALGRVTERKATGEGTLAYTYDTNAQNAVGQLASSSGNGLAQRYEYDALGRLISETVSEVSSGRSYTTSTRYDDKTGQVRRLAYPNNLVLEYDYSEKGYLQTIKNAENGYVYQEISKLDEFGHVSQSALGNGLKDARYYSRINGQMTGTSVFGVSGENLLNLTYDEYDGFGNLKKMNVHIGQVGEQYQFTESYDYDVLHRLKSNGVAGFTTVSYDYDAVGNLVLKSDYGNTYDYSTSLPGHSGGGNNAVKQVTKINNTKVGFSYDGRGNMTKGDGLTSASYNAMDKPTQMTKNGVSTSFIYLPDHSRFKQVKGGTTTYYAGKGYEEEITGSKTTWRVYIGDVAVVSETSGELATIRYTHRDRLGSARLFTDKKGKVEAIRHFDPFGKPRKANGNSSLPALLADLAMAKTNRGFTDHEHLDELELIHMNGRVYDYNLGRFMSVDPVIQSPTDSQSINPYSYIMNNPLSGTDPSGYCAAATGTHIKSCGDMKVEVKVTMKDGSTKTGSTIVKDVNFKNGAEVKSAMAQGVGAIGGAMKAMDIGSQKQISTNTSAQSGSNVGGQATPNSGTTNKVLDTVKGVAKAGLNSLKRGGVIGLGLAPSMMGNGELSEEQIAASLQYSEELKEAQLSGIRSAEKQVERHRGNKIAVIGQGQQTRVIPYRDSVGGISFSIPSRYIYESNYMSQFPSDVQEQLSVAFNRGWIKGVMNSGYQIHDIGMAKGRELPGPWYGAELQEVAMRRYPTIKVKFK